MTRKLLEKWVKKAHLYGFKNLDEVRRFQRRNGLKVDGLVGPETMSKLRSVGVGSESNPIQLPNIDVVEKRPDDFILALADNKQVMDFVNNDPIFGLNRQRMVAAKYTEDNPFRQGADIAGNIAMTVLLGAGLANGIASGIVAPLYEGGIAALPGVLANVAASVGGGTVGAALADELSLKLTGKTWYLNMQQAGANEFNAAMSNPGGWAGSYAGSRLLSAVGLNGVQMQPVRDQAIEVASTAPVREISYQQAPQGVSRYQAHYTSKGYGSNGSASGQRAHARGTSYTSGSNGNRGNGAGVQYRVMGDVNTGGSGSVYMQNTPVTYTWNTPIAAIPIGNNREIFAPVTTTVAAPAETYRYQQVINPDERFEQWYAQLPEGTVQAYTITDDPYHAAGNYKIVRTSDFRNRGLYQVANQDALINQDSTRLVRRHYNEAPKTVIVSGGSPNITGPVMDVSGAVDMRPSQNGILLME